MVAVVSGGVKSAIVLGLKVKKINFDFYLKKIFYYYFCFDFQVLKVIEENCRIEP